MVYVGYELVTGFFVVVVGTVITYLVVKKIWGDWVVISLSLLSFLSSLSYLIFGLLWRLLR